MSIVIWSETMKVGETSIDHEHEHLINVINKLGEEIERGTTLDMADFLLSEIYAQIETHFAIEERAMRDRSYPGLYTHKEDHESLLDSLRDIIDEAAHSTSSEITSALGRKMNQWFALHFRTRDRAFTQYSSTRHH